MRASKITAVDFFDDLTSGYAKKRFFGGFSLIILFFLGIIWFFELKFENSFFKEISLAIFIEIVSGLIIILCFYMLYVFFIGSDKAAKEVHVVRSQDISEHMHALPKNVRYYSFWGRSGSFFRSHPLMVLDKEAREEKRTTLIEVLLPDPDDERLVRSYREILLALGENPPPNPLLPNVIATCMACAIISSNNKHVDINVYLSRFLPAFRVDLSDNEAILTQDDKKKSALLFDNNSEFYDMFRSTFKSERDVSRKVNWDSELFAGLTLDAKSSHDKTLKAFGIKIENVNNIQQEVAQLITSRPHRY